MFVSGINCISIEQVISLLQSRLVVCYKYRFQTRVSSYLCLTPPPQWTWLNGFHLAKVEVGLDMELGYIKSVDLDYASHIRLLESRLLGLL